MVFVNKDINIVISNGSIAHLNVLMDLLQIKLYMNAHNLVQTLVILLIRQPILVYKYVLSSIMEINLQKNVLVNVQPPIMVILQQEFVFRLVLNLILD